MLAMSAAVVGSAPLSCSEESDAVAAPVAADELAAPRTGGAELSGQPPPALAGPVGHGQLRVEPDRVAGLTDAQVELPVLAAPDRFVEESDLVEDVAAHDAQVGGLGLALAVGAVVGAAAEADGGVVGAGDRGLERAAAIGAHEAADVRGSGALERFDRAAGVPGGELGVRVDAHDDGAAARADRRVQADGDVGCGVVDEADAVIGCGEALGELGRAVGGGAEREDELGGAVDLLREDGGDGVLEVVDLVEHGHDERDAGRRCCRIVLSHPPIMS